MTNEHGSVTALWSFVYAITCKLTTVMMTVAFTRLLAPIQVWNQDSETPRNLFAHAQTCRLFFAASCLNGFAAVILLTAYLPSSDQSME